jgi:hypothetical protein
MQLKEKAFVHQFHLDKLYKQLISIYNILKIIIQLFYLFKTMLINKIKI